MASRQFPKWQIMSKAPRDGTYFIATDSHMYFIVNWPEGCEIGEWYRSASKDEWRKTADSPFQDGPMCWMPLPPRPIKTSFSAADWAAIEDMERRRWRAEERELNTHPHPKNACAGAFKDWLEVNLTPICNATCSWCVERDGWHPKSRASWMEIAVAIVKAGCKNINLLGGEPTLYPHLQPLIKYLVERGHNVWVTTNGSRLLGRLWVEDHLRGVTGVNISLHHYNLTVNHFVTGITLSSLILSDCIVALHKMGAKVRFNCNIISGYIDSHPEIRRYLAFAKFMKADSVRFSELIRADDQFIDLAQIMGHQYGLNDEPFTLGCYQEAKIDGVPVSFRQMCGLLTNKRKEPVNPASQCKPVLYYDGNIYNGWQAKEETMTTKQLMKILDDVKNGKKTPAEAAVEIKTAREESTEVRHVVISGGGGGVGGGCGGTNSCAGPRSSGRCS